MDSKKPYFSKTIIFNILFALAALYPPISDWMSKNVEVLGMLWGGIGVVLRLVTKDKIVLGN